MKWKKDILPWTWPLCWCYSYMLVHFNIEPTTIFAQFREDTEIVSLLNPTIRCCLLCLLKCRVMVIFHFTFFTFYHIFFWGEQATGAEHCNPHSFVLFCTEYPSLLTEQYFALYKIALCWTLLNFTFISKFTVHCKRGLFAEKTSGFGPKTGNWAAIIVTKVANWLLDFHKNW